VAVLEWEYLKIDLNQRGPREDELDVLNHVGAARWELVGITATNIAYLKRRVEEMLSPTPRIVDREPRVRTDERSARSLV
jgi:hypothetical protein